MEIVSPTIFIATYMLAPFSPTKRPPPWNHPSTFLAILFVLHYLNRAIISPLRSPGRARIHISVVFSAVVFNLINPPLMAAFLSAPREDLPPTPFEFPSAHQYVASVLPTQVYLLLTSKFADQFIGLFQLPLANSWTSPTFIVGLVMFFFGAASNIYHDEVLYKLRRNNPPGPDGKPHYAIPYGFLYRYISYPNYFSEWIEFIGFAIAASPYWGYTPPWMFVVAEIMVMLPRAYKGHQWYLQKFPDYPKDRKAAIPFVF